MGYQHEKELYENDKEKGIKTIKTERSERRNIRLGTQGIFAICSHA